MQWSGGLRARWQRWNDIGEFVLTHLLRATALPLLSALILWLGWHNLGPAIDAAHGKGIPGTFHVTERQCKQSFNCTLYGDFHSDDGSDSWTDTRWMDGATDKVHVGDDLRALDTGVRGGIHQPTGSNQWALDVLIMVFGALIGLAWLWFFILRRSLGDKRPKTVQRRAAGAGQHRLGETN